MNNEDPVIAACEAEWDKQKDNCSGFVSAVATRLGITLNGQANAMIDFLEQNSTWTTLGAEPKTAIDRANQGYFVIGGLKANNHGHVVVIVKSPGAIQPVGYWGRFGAVGKKATTINWAWVKHDLPNVRFYARKL